MSASIIAISATIAAGAYYALYARRNHAAQAETLAGVPTFSSFGFKKLQLASTENVNHNVKRLRFALAGPETPSGLALTSALLAITFPGGSWLPTLRPYTPVDIDQPGHIEFLIKKYPGGKQSGYLHTLRPGDSVTFFRIPAYAYKANEQAHIGLVAGGQGITPCFQLLRGILDNPADRTRVTLVWGVNADSDVFLSKELAALQKAHPERLTTKIVASSPIPGSQYTKGHVTPDLLKSLGVVPGGEKTSGVGKVFISGPPAMEKAFTGKDGVFAQLGFAKAQVHNF